MSTLTCVYLTQLLETQRYLFGFPFEIPFAKQISDAYLPIKTEQWRLIRPNKLLKPCSSEPKTNLPSTTSEAISVLISDS